MPNKNNRVPKPQKLRLGKEGRSPKLVTPSSARGRGRIMTDFQDINWTPSKLSIAIVGLSIPYLIGMVASFVVGNILIGLVLLGLGILTIGIYLLLRYLEKSDV